MTIHVPPPHVRTARRLPIGRNAPQPWEHVVSVSGGKDSTATYLLAVERGMPFTAVFADTGHEWLGTYDYYIAELPARAGGPPIVTVKADFGTAMERKRRFILRHWPKRGVPQDRVERAAALMVPSGVPFLDLCMVKGRFPSAKARFCTDELKLVPMWFGVQKPIMQAGRTLVSWQGVRGEESLARRDLPRWQRINPAPHSLPKTDKDAASTFRAYAYRPIHAWKVDEVFAMHRRHGIEANPLYGIGADRVGCWPCIFAKKHELRLIAGRFPEAIDRLEEMERIVGEVCKRGASSFFSYDKTPGRHLSDLSSPMPGVREVVEWSKTSRGGRQYDLLLADFGTACNQWGACE